jgi:hypothetical protein
VKKVGDTPPEETDSIPVKLFKAEDGQTSLEVQLKDETVWLNQQ